MSHDETTKKIERNIYRDKAAAAINGWLKDEGITDYTVRIDSDVPQGSMIFNCINGEGFISYHSTEDQEFFTGESEYWREAN